MPIFDRAITSAPLRSLIGKLFTDGIAPNPSNNLQVTTGSGMTVTVQAGFAICGSCLKLEENARTLAVQASDANYDRIDSVVMRLNINDDARYCDLYVVQGVAASAPVRPALNRTSTIWELGLADIFISKGSGAISEARITDTRYDAERCGIMSSISQFDTTTIYNQVQADLAEFKAEEQAGFLAWYEKMKGVLSEEAAANLQEQVDDIKNSILDSMSAIEANTQEDQLAGALALKELSTELKKSVSDGKTLVANAITEKGIETATDATFAVMAENISQLSSEPDSYICRGWFIGKQSGTDITIAGSSDESEVTFSMELDGTTYRWIYYYAVSPDIDLTKYSELSITYAAVMKWSWAHSIILVAEDGTEITLAHISETSGNIKYDVTALSGKYKLALRIGHYKYSDDNHGCGTITLSKAALT